MREVGSRIVKMMRGTLGSLNAMVEVVLVDKVSSRSCPEIVARCDGCCLMFAQVRRRGADDGEEQK